MQPEEYVEAVLALVESVPPGRVTTYGALADAVGSRGPRSVGRVMSQHGGSVPWWRVVRADGSLPPSHDEEALARYREEGTPLRRSGRVDLRAAAWWPEAPPESSERHAAPAELSDRHAAPADRRSDDSGGAAALP